MVYGSLCPAGGPEPEGAGPSSLNSVSDSNMCPTLFYLRSQYFCFCSCLRVFLYLLLFICLFLFFFHFFLYTFFPFPTSFFFSLLLSVLCPILSCVRRQGKYALDAQSIELLFQSYLLRNAESISYFLLPSGTPWSL